MNNTVYIAEALPGAGKSQGFINALDQQDYFKESVVLALPTKVLTKDIVKRLQDVGINAVVINSDTTKRVASHVELALLEREELGPVVLVITQETLKSIDPAYLDGWSLVMDEVSKVANNTMKLIGINAFAHYFEEFVDIDPVTSRAYIKAGLKREARNTYYDVVDDRGMATIANTLGALLKDDCEVYIKEVEDKDGKAKWQVKAIDYHDYTKVFRFPKKVTLMGNGVTKSLMYKHLARAGYDFEVSEYSPAFKPYKLAPTLLPMFPGSRISATMMMTKPDGSVATEWSEDVLLHQALKRCMEYLDDVPTLAQVHSWCKFPFEDYPNVTVTPFDARGLNTYADHCHTINLIHGNADTNEDQMNTRMLERMDLDVDEGKEALRYERLQEMIVQHITRTQIRKFDGQESPTFHIVPNEAIAEEIGQALKTPYLIDRSLIMQPYATKAMASKVVQIEEARKLKAQGLSNRQIAKELGVSAPTVGNWFKAA